MDNGTGIGGPDEEKHNEILIRFKNCGLGKEQQHMSDKGNYGRGGHANSAEICCTQLIISRNEYDIETGQVCIFVKKMVGPNRVNFVRFTIKPNNGTNGRGKGDLHFAKSTCHFVEFMEKWTPVRKNELTYIVQTLFDDSSFPTGGVDTSLKRKTGVVYIMFGIKSAVQKNNIDERIKTLYFTPPTDVDDKPIPDFTYRFNGEELEHIYAESWLDADPIVPMQTYTILHTNGYQPLGTNNKPSSCEISYLHNGEEVTFGMSVRRFKTDKNWEDPRPFIVTCGGQVIDFDMDTHKKYWEKLNLCNFLQRLVSMQRSNKTIYDFLRRFRKCKTFNVFKSAVLGNDITLVFNIHPWMLEYTKRTFASSLKNMVAHMFNTAIYRVNAALTEYSHVAPDNRPFKYLWGSSRSRDLTNEMFPSDKMPYINKVTNDSDCGTRKRKNFQVKIRRRTLRHQGNYCRNPLCGFKSDEIGSFQWDHWDGFRDNNNPTNCAALCSICHSIKSKEENFIRSLSDDDIQSARWDVPWNPEEPPADDIQEEYINKAHSLYNRNIDRVEWTPTYALRRAYRIFRIDTEWKRLSMNKLKKVAQTMPNEVIQIIENYQFAFKEEQFKRIIRLIPKFIFKYPELYSLCIEQLENSRPRSVRAKRPRYA